MVQAMKAARVATPAWAQPRSAGSGFVPSAFALSATRSTSLTESRAQHRRTQEPENHETATTKIQSYGATNSMQLLPRADIRDPTRPRCGTPADQRRQAHTDHNCSSDPSRSPASH